MKEIIFLSSTLLDLSKERKAVFDAFNKMYYVFAFEYQGVAIPNNALEVIREKIKECAIFILLLGESAGTPIYPLDVRMTQAEWMYALKLKKKIFVFEKDLPVTDRNLIEFREKVRFRTIPAKFRTPDELVSQISVSLREHIHSLEKSRAVFENQALPDLVHLLGKYEGKYELDFVKEQYNKILTFPSHVPLEITAEGLLGISRVNHVQGDFINLAKHANEAAVIFAYSGLSLKAINSERLSTLSLQIERKFKAHVRAANELLQLRIPKIRNKTERAFMEAHFRRDLSNSYFDLYETMQDSDSREWLARQIRREANLSESILKNNYMSNRWSFENIGEFTFDTSLIYIPNQNIATLFAYEGKYDTAMAEIERLKSNIPSNDFLCHAQILDREATIHLLSNNLEDAQKCAIELLTLGREKNIYYQIFRSERLLRQIYKKSRI